MKSRRSFIKNTSLAVSGLNALPHITAKSLLENTGKYKKTEWLSGIQIAPHSFYDEGVEYCLDLLQEEGKINTLLVNPYSYYGAMGRPLHLMGDHGVQKVDNSKRKLPYVWVDHDPQIFKELGIFHAHKKNTDAYSDKDILNELQEKVKKRNMKLYLRLYEGWGRQRITTIENWDKTLCVDVYGREHKDKLPCWNNPYFQNWWLLSVNEMVKNYKLDGIQFGAERGSMFYHTFHLSTEPTCFCSYCRKKANSLGINAERAQIGTRILYEYIQKLSKGFNPPEGTVIGLFRIFMEYPEIILWEKLDVESRENLLQMVGNEVKKVNPNVEFGNHIHDGVNRFIADRVSNDYSAISKYADFIKIIVYHEIIGQRMQKCVDTYQRALFNEFKKSDVLLVLYRLYGYNPQEFPAYEELQDGMDGNYVYRETKRCYDEADGKAKVYAGIGMDIPKGKNWGEKFHYSNPAKLRGAVYKAFEAGAAGIVASREYEEISLKSLKVFGKAVEEVKHRL